MFAIIIIFFPHREVFPWSNMYEIRNSIAYQMLECNWIWKLVLKPFMKSRIGRFSPRVICMRFEIQLHISCSSASGFGISSKAIYGKTSKLAIIKINPA